MKHDTTQSLNGSRVNSEYPVIVMSMPGCYEVWANEAHMRRFPTVPSAVKNASGAYQQVLDSKSPVFDQQTLCYCVKVGGALALEPEDCAFESAAATLSPNEPGAWEPSLGFFDLRENHCRTYSAFKVHSRLPAGEKSWLEATLVELNGLEVKVDTRQFDSAHRPVEIEITAYLRGHAWLPAHKSHVKAGDTYYAFDETLRNALTELMRDPGSFDSVRDRTVEEVRKISVNYAPVIAFVADLFSDKENVISRLERARARTFDAPAVHQFADDILHELQTGAKQREVMGDPRLNDVALRQNLDAFEQQLPSLLQSRPGQFVLLYRGRVIDSDMDRSKLLARVPREYWHRDLLVKRVVAPDNSECPIPLPTPNLCET